MESTIVSDEATREIISTVFAEKPVGKYHEIERLWEILFRLNVVSDNELPDFLNDIASAPVGASSCSSVGTSSDGTSSDLPTGETGGEQDPFSSFVKGFQQSIGKMNDFASSDEGQNIMGALPEGVGNSVKSVLGDLSSVDNPFAEILKVFMK